jgi:hypothetical protein
MANRLLMISERQNYEKVADNPEFSENEFEDTAFFCDILA